MKSVSRSAGSMVLYFLITVLFSGTICYGQSKNEGMIIYPYAYPLKVSKDYRYLVDGSNQPFFWSGDAAWSLIAQLNTRDADVYLENRRRKGFTVIMVSLIEHKFSTNAPANFYDEMPFKGSPFVSPNEKYFEHADSVIESAWKHNILVLLAPLYLGYDCKDEGWCAEVKKSSSADMRSWGRYVGTRYKKFNNIIWLIGGDTDPSPVKDKVLEMVKGIRESDSIHLFSAHNQPESMAVDPWQDESWLTVNNVYSYDSVIYKRYEKAYGRKPVIPYYQIESAYENEHNSTPKELRSYAYWAILSGAMGHVFGNCPVWHFGSATTWCNTNDWRTEMNNAGSESMDHLQRLFRSRSWHTLVPDFENRLVTSVYGSWGTKDHISSARTDDGNTIIAYLPSGITVTVDLSKVEGSQARCWWYDPSNGQSEEIGSFSTNGLHSFTPNSNGDRVLVIDNVNAKLSAPGRDALVNSLKIRK